MNSVCAPYQGLWRRAYLRDARGTDTDTEVFWLQAGAWYVDLRVPAGRPDFGSVNGLDALGACHARWLARVEGFAGRLQVEHDLLTWHRALDFQPPAAVADVGRIERRGDRMLEFGVLQDYEELWRHTPAADDPLQVMKLRGDDGGMRGLAVTCGDWRMQCVDRRPALPRGHRLDALFAGGQRAATDLFDCAIDFAVRDGGRDAWRIQHSSQPWREGMLLHEEADMEAGWQPLDPSLDHPTQ